MTRLLLIGLLFLRITAHAQAVVLNNAAREIPIKSLPELTIAGVSLHFGHHQEFDSIARNYWGVSSFNGDTVRDAAGFNALHDKLKFFNTIFLECSAGTPFGADWLAFVKDLEQHARVFIVLSGEGANLKHFDSLASPIVWYPTDNENEASLAAQTLFGGTAIANKLPQTFSPKYAKGAGSMIKKTRLGYATPEAVGVDSKDLVRIDSIVKAGIAAHAAPAVVILLAKDGEVIYSKAFGKHKYWGDAPTRLDDIFDMASCTKVTATTPSIMHLYETHQINLDSPIANYVTALRNIPNKKDLRVREALLHEAGFTPYIKFYESLKPTDLSTDSSSAYPTKVADNYYLRANYFNDTQWPVTLASPVLTRGKFVYSDLSMYMMKEVFENVSHQRLNEYVLQNLYLPLGMQSTGYLPRNRFPKERIVPTTENDNWFRNMPVQGYVNDPGAAMAGGVEGHAGLFASANDLAIYYQMLLNGGSYGGRKYFDSTTVRYFTARQSKVTYRGLGFDRTNLDRRETNDHRSDQAFGHSGYTGTFVWVDPKYKIVYICLTNRVYPDDNKTFGVSKVNVRPLTLNAFYDAVVKAAK
ncbi:serine hydrolase domain-containing protein [Puia sp.]|jgi:CubicO group peptidase (beta-lactamase class C family)|uniref:serine hydrolase domain-containing protein n=1 Tax=Puia sp. TaxID=2045100 RepID=UPI002F3E64BB